MALACERPWSRASEPWKSSSLSRLSFICFCSVIDEYDDICCMKLSLSTGFSGVWVCSSAIRRLKNGLSPNFLLVLSSAFGPADVVLLVLVIVVMVLLSCSSDPEVESLCRDEARARERARA